MAISSPGIGSNLDINSIVAKLMSVEQQPLALLDKKTSAAQAKLAAMGTVSNALTSFQSALSNLTTAKSFNVVKATASDAAVLSATADGSAVSGVYKVNVSQLAAAQSLSTKGRTSVSTAIGGGASTTITFQLGSISGGSFGIAGTAVNAGVATAGLANGALTINGTAIANDSSTRSAQAIATAINAKTATTGVTASARTATSATLFTTFGTIDTSSTGSSYALSVGGVQIASQTGAAGPLDKARLDTALSGVSSQLAAAGISVSGTAVGGDLQFKNADGANISVVETVVGTVTGGIGKGTGTANAGSSLTATGTLDLASDGSPITVGGSNPAAAGLTAGTGGQYLGASFAQDAQQTSGTIVVDAKNNTLQGIRDAINKAGFGVTATIVSDGSAEPYHLVLTSNKSGAKSSMKISAAGTDGGPIDATVAAMFSYDPAGSQNLQQNSAAKSTQLSVNGIQVVSESNTVSDAIQGVSLNVSALGTTSINVSADTATVKANVNAFVKAFNELGTTVKGVSNYNAGTKTAGPLFGDATIRSLQSALRSQLSKGVTGLPGGIDSLAEIGVTFQKDGSLAVDSGKLDTAIKNNLFSVAGLFAVLGSATDSQVSFDSSTSATKPGEYALRVTQLATQGALATTGPIAATTVIDAGTKWKVSLDQDSSNVLSSHTATVEIPAGSYSRAQLATAIQAAINGASNFSTNKLAVNASVGTDNRLTVASNTWGSASNIEITAVSGTSPDTLFAGATPSAGLNVAGTIDGEPATGSGQYLTARGGSPAEGLKVKITGGSVPADRGTVSFSQGFAYQLNNLATDYLDSKGLLATRKDGLNLTIKDIDKQRASVNTRLVEVEKRYRAQFTALDAAISSMNTTASFLAQQLVSLR